jgi:glutathione S-transferase
MGSASPPTIKLYTNHSCPWAHRAHIALRELGLPFTEEIIDLEVPRTPEYLKVNPRGLVPTIDYNGEIIPESGIVAQFLVDAHPSHLEKTSSEEGGALQRARINFFVDAYVSKVLGSFFTILRADGEEAEKAAGTYVDAIVKELEPLLKDAGPFFGGSSRLTLAEVTPPPLFYYPFFILMIKRSKPAPSSSVP